MFRTLIKTDDVAVGARTYQVRYFEQQTDRGSRRYAAEILLAPGDRIILDGDSIANLEARNSDAPGHLPHWNGSSLPISDKGEQFP